MKVRVQVVIEADDGLNQSVDEVACLERTGLSPPTPGLTLAEAKGLLEQVQGRMAAQQVTGYLAAHQACPHCGQDRSHKGHHTIVFRTVFGKLSLSGPRLYRCACERTNTRSFSPLAELLPEPTAPELLYLQTKWISLMSYGLTVGLLSAILPLEAEVNTRWTDRGVHLLLQVRTQTLNDELHETFEAWYPDTKAAA